VLIEDHGKLKNKDVKKELLSQNAQLEELERFVTSIGKHSSDVRKPQSPSPKIERSARRCI
jgi:hypothetical protein